MVGPGSRSSYAQVDTVRRPRDTVVGRAHSTPLLDATAARLADAPATAAGAVLRAANMPLTNNLRDTIPRESFTANPLIHPQGNRESSGMRRATLAERCVA
ncbi:hypothetical protein GCM10012278_10710 [Nonomuraea glycinis]|uniref:Uncharacterized protein n=1 Tax=Nonomuraea glycinis TaxID=2047744 RepID=A0A918A057_9ACTN|nr:hypothetical protein GCM10012278_10710 [Nonomuraea glycinis]